MLVTDRTDKNKTQNKSTILKGSYGNPYIYVMEWSGRRTGYKQRSPSKMETTAGGGSNQVLFYSSRQFSAHPKSSLARIDKRTARAARNTRYRYNQIGPLDHKLADNCLLL